MKDKASFTYFADRYGLKDFAASYEGTSEAAPAPSQYAVLIDQVKRERVRVVFGEVGYSSKLMQQLASDTGTRFIDGLRVTALGTAPASTYADMMRENTRIIVSNLR
jgi:zinc/manganese transport system substrate-binding protein/manganese/iron transport system substrate-binding protein